MRKLLLSACTALLSLAAFAGTSFGILVNDTVCYVGEHTDDFEEFTQYLAHVSVKAGDYCQLYDLENDATWAVTLNSASVAGFALSGDRYVVSTTGCYDFYIKIKLNQDQLYIGPGTATCGSGTVVRTSSSGTTVIPGSGYASAVPSQCEDVMLQAFYWGSYDIKKPNLEYFGKTTWTTLLNSVDEIGTYFDLVWLPPSSTNTGGMGYMPTRYDLQNCSFGLQAGLVSLINALHDRNTRVVADIVINHSGNKSTWCDYWALDFGEYGTFQPQSSWITSNDEGASKCAVGPNADDGQDSPSNFDGGRDWDHKNTQVQAMCRAYLNWLRTEIGYDGWRYDYAKGFHVSHINDYNSASHPYFSVMEYWDGDANKLKTRIDQASQNTLTFDFALKYALRDAFANNQLSYGKLRNAGMRGVGYSKYAVTFIDNHDTFQRYADNAVDVLNYGKGESVSDANYDKQMQMNAYILSMPGVPCVFYPHWYKYKSEIQAMIRARKAAGIHSESAVIDEQALQYGYKATVQGKYGQLILYLGSAATEAAPAGFKQGFKSNKVAIYYTGNDRLAVEQLPAQPAFDPAAPCYNIMGQRVDAAYHGVVIQNGHKYIR
ncbi:MAG: hypothetical protein IJ581_02200 [Paludibacteraceae bacterium]|nr:hypothetical protein [Paludibacteraceae bacterium]